MATDEDLKTEDFDIQKMKEFQQKAIKSNKRSCHKLNNFLKGINQDI